MLKYKFLNLIIFFLLLLSLQIVDAKNAKELTGKIITIDPGHGGRDSGTIYGKLYESTLNLEISNKLKEELEKEGAVVYLTRDSDEDLSSKWDAKKKRGDLYRRIIFIQNKKSDLYLSIHINAGPGDGQEVLYHPINKDNEVLADSIMAVFKDKFKTRRIIRKTNLYLYSNTRVLGVLIECGFLNNSNDRYLLQQEDFQKELGKAITLGVKNYYNKKEAT